MRATKKVPIKENALIDCGDGMYKWFRVEPVELGKMQYTQLYTWVTDDGETCSSPADALVHFLKRAEKEPKPLPAGEYVCKYDGILQEKDRVVIRTPNGDIIIRNS